MESFIHLNKALFDKEDSRFHDLLNTVDSVSSELHKNGVELE